MRLLPYSPSQHSSSDGSITPWIAPTELHVAVAGLEPPTKARWEVYRPLITELYKRKQHTARQIIEELKQDGFYASEKMLRDRFRAWGVNNKNRTSRRPECGNDAAGNIVVSPTVDVVRSDGLKYPIKAAAADLPTRRSMVAVSDWYDCILANHDKAFSSWEDPCPMFIVTNQFSVALCGLEDSDHKFGWKQLREIGPRIDHALLSCHSLSLVWLINNMIVWKSRQPEVVDAVRRFWALRSREVLGPRHPITIIIASLCHRAVSEELCDHFFATINSKMPNDPDISEQQSQSALQSQIIYGQVLLARGRYDKVDATLDNLATKTSSAERYAYQHPQVLRLQAHSQKEQGNLRRADELFGDTILKLRKCGKELTGVTSISLIDRAKVKDAMDELKACEEILYEALRMQPLCADAAILQRPMALYHLYDVLGRRGKIAEQEALRRTYPYAFDISGVSEKMVD